MPSPSASNAGRRLLLAVGTSKFDALTNLDLRFVPDELALMAKTFAALGYERQSPTASLDPDSRGLLSLVGNLRTQTADEDIVVTYYSGHGVRDEELLYLLTRDSRIDDLDATSVPAEDLARALTKQSRAAQVLLIIDACCAAAGASQFVQVV